MTTQERIEQFDKALEPLVHALPAIDLLKLIHKEFPLPGSGMPKSFQGNHSLTLNVDRLDVHIWCDNKCWYCYYKL